MTKRIFDAIPLTPVHVGTGEPITPEEYFDDGDYLVRFNPHTVIAQFSEQERRDFEGHIDRNAMKDAQGVLRSRARRSTESHLYRIRMGRSSAGYLRGVTGNPDRGGDVRPLMWNLGRKCAVIPGSAVKGAIRTAVLNSYVASLNPHELQGWERRVESMRQSNRRVDRGDRDGVAAAGATGSGRPRPRG
jgi:CRISPR-associated protein Csm5